MNPSVVSINRIEFATGPRVASFTSLFRYATMTWILGTLALLPVKLFSLPFNMELMDLWMFAWVPLFFLFLVSNPISKLSWSYTTLMLIILIGSLVSTIGAINPVKSLIVIFKEIYIYFWFILLTLALCHLKSEDLYRAIRIWRNVVFIHSLVIMAQFLSPEFWRFTQSLANNVIEYEHYRSPGLFTNANSAAFFQLTGLVPVFLSKGSRLINTLMAVFIFVGLLATGSMGAILGLFCGTGAALFAIFSWDKSLARLLKYFIGFAVIVTFFGGIASALISQDPESQAHLERILFGRADRSSGGRFDLWQRGIDVFVEQSGVFYGVGPENFREVDGRDKQLHNDFIAFSVERGLITAFAMVIFALLALGRAAHLFRASMRRMNGLSMVVFISAITAIVIESLFHQIFHYRELWLVLAFQETMIYKASHNQKPFYQDFDRDKY